MIKPTIFIGLGTTGTEILKLLRELMSEAYNRSGLPVFRYVAIDTTEYEIGDNSPQLEEYERISVINATIEKLAPIQNRLDPNQPHYNPHLADWLNPDLLHQIHSFKDGASNIRMAGRLCLWENWEQIWYTLSIARNDIINSDNFLKTREILVHHYEAKNLEVPNHLVDDKGINVYVFGSLCGGTCSGMLIDIAYLIRNILGGNDHNKIHGIFTMYDRLLAASPGVDIAVRAANCYASLSELNYYNHQNTTYDVTFPNSLRVNTQQKPFDYELFTSPSSKLPNIRFVSRNGALDEDGLNLMVALNLFAETVGDTDGLRETIPPILLAFPGYGELKPVPAGEIPTMVKCLASFGLTAVWYPKYRIATAAACYANRQLCNNLKGTHTSIAKIKVDAINEWHHIKEDVDILTSPQVEGRPTLKGEIEGYLNKLESEVLNRKLSAQRLETILKSYPESDAGSFANRFSWSGTYYEWIAAKVDNCKKAFLTAIDKSLDNQLAKVDFHGTYGLGDVRAFFEELDRIIEEALQQCPSRLPTLDLNELNFDPMRGAENNIWIKIIGKQGKAIKAHRDRLIDQYCQLIVGKNGIYQKVRNYFLLPVLEDVRVKLGFQVYSDGPTIKQQLDQIEVNLEHCAQRLKEEYEYVIEPPRFECVKIVTNNPQNSIQTDAKSLSNQIINNITSMDLIADNGVPTKMSNFLNKDREDLMLQMTETFRRIALKKINDDVGNGSVVTKAQNLLETDGEGIRNLARRSNPYIEFTPMYHPIAFDRGRKIILGPDPTGQRLDALRDSLGFERIGHSSVDHLLFFYEEEAGFAPDDMAAYELLKMHFETTPGVYGHSTHQDPNYYDLTFQYKKQKLQQWCEVLGQLVPQIWDNINPHAFDNVFRRENDKCVFEYAIDGIMATLELLDDLNSIQRLSKEENSTAYNHFFQSVQDGFAQIDREKITHLINELLTSVEDFRARHELSEIYSGFLHEIYPTDDNYSRFRK